MTSVGFPEGKVERTEQKSLKSEQGKIWLPMEAPWLVASAAELFSFLHCGFNDLVDSTNQLLDASHYAGFKHRLKYLYLSAQF